MGLMQQALKTYDLAEAKYAGVYFADQKEPLAPTGHTITKADIEITLSADGIFMLAKAVDKNDAKTIFPVSEESAGRTSAPSAHPLCDQLGYLTPGNPEKLSLFVDGLEAWMNSPFSHPFLKPIFLYVTGGTIETDLLSAGLLHAESGGGWKEEKAFIRWRIEGTAETESACWRNRALHKAYSGYYASSSAEAATVCMLTGDADRKALQHAKGIVALNGNAKLISSNDKTGFTYRGRFCSDAEALTIGYSASQKAHNTLRWLIANQGEYLGGRCFVCWNPEGKQIPSISRRFRALKDSENSQSYTPSEYKDQLRETLRGWQSTFAPGEQAVTAVFDAATTGRLSVVYYSELQASDFVERLAFWDETCSWNNGRFGIQSPSIQSMAEIAFGTLRSDHFEADDGIKKQAVLRLIACRLECAKYPKDIERQLVEKASRLYLYEDSEKTRYLRSNLLFVTCAAIRKYRYDYLKEEWSMALEPEKQDRSYQFGRLLAVMEKIERDTYDDEKRETNAIRRQQAFVSRPFSTYASIMGHLKNAYYPRLNPGMRRWYDKMIGQIINQLSSFEADLNKPLSDTYLLGYYLQKNDFYTKKEKMEE